MFAAVSERTRSGREISSPEIRDRRDRGPKSRSIATTTIRGRAKQRSGEQIKESTRGRRQCVCENLPVTLPPNISLQLPLGRSVLFNNRIDFI